MDNALTVTRPAYNGKPDSKPTLGIARTDCLCPQCAAPLQIITDGFVGEEWAPAYYVRGTKRSLRMIARPFAVCMACDYCLDFLKEK